MVDTVNAYIIFGNVPLKVEGYINLPERDVGIFGGFEAVNVYTVKISTNGLAAYLKETTSPDIMDLLDSRILKSIEEQCYRELMNERS